MDKNIGDNYRICCSCWYNKLQPSDCRVGNSSRFEWWTKFPPSFMFLRQRMSSCMAVLISLLLPSFPLQWKKHLRTKSFVLISKPFPDPELFVVPKAWVLKLPQPFFLLKNTYLINFQKLPGSPDSFCPGVVFCTCHTIWQSRWENVISMVGK